MPTEAGLNVVATLKSRASVGRLTEPAPAGDDLRLILEAAARAPDHGKMKPWRFFTIQGEARARLGDLMADTLARREPASDANALDRERQKPLRAPLLLGVGAKVVDNGRIPVIEQVLAAGAAAQNALLAAHALGYGGVWRTGDAVYDDALKAAFGLAPADALLGFLYLGTPVQPQAFSGTVEVSVTEWTGA